MNTSILLIHVRITTKDTSLLFCHLLIQRTQKICAQMDCENIKSVIRLLYTCMNIVFFRTQIVRNYPTLLQNVFLSTQNVRVIRFWMEFDRKNSNIYFCFPIYMHLHEGNFKVQNVLNKYWSRIEIRELCKNYIKFSTMILFEEKIQFSFFFFIPSHCLLCQESIW